VFERHVEHYLHSDATQRLAAVSSLAGWLEAVPD
jgi:hypothetical protein